MLFLSIFYLYICSVYGKTNVPVLLWAPNRLPTDFPVLSALQEVSYQRYFGQFLDSFHSDKILLFLQDELSIEDLSSHANELKNVDHWVQSTQSIYLPAVENPGFLTHDLASHGYDVITIEPGFANGGIIINNITKTLVVIKLPPTETNPSRKNAMQKADEVIESVLSKIGGQADFIAIFTAMMPSVKTAEYSGKGVLNRVKRGGEIAVSDPGRHFSECVLLYLSTHILINKTEMGRTTSLNVPREKHEDVADCGDGVNGMLKMLFREVGDLIKLHVKLKFLNKRNKGWFINEAEVTEVSKHFHTAYLYPVTPMISVPMKRSYVCGKDFTMRSNSTDRVVYTLVIRGMQVEAFAPREQKKFSPPWDCVGFFSIPIWSGLLTASILVIILFIGLFMLLSLKAADKFDDPKGKHINVAPASAE